MRAGVRLRFDGPASRGSEGAEDDRSTALLLNCPRLIELAVPDGYLKPNALGGRA